MSDFEVFMSQLSETNATLESLTDFEKVSNNVAKIAIKLNQLNYLLGKEDLMAEFMILGLRMTSGISKEEFRCRFGEDVMEVYGSTIRKYEDAGLLREERGNLFLTRRGLSLSNTVMADFL